MADLWIVRVIFFAVFVAMTYHLGPFGFTGAPAIVLGIFSGIAIIVFEIRLRKVTLKRLLGAAIGSVLGIVGAFLMSLVMGSSLTSDSVSFLGSSPKSVISFPPAAAAWRSSDRWRPRSARRCGSRRRDG